MLVHAKLTASAAETSEASPTCWICGEPKAFAWKERSLDRPLGPEDLRITDSRYGMTLGLWKCARCDFIFANDADVARLTELYARLDDPAYEEGEESRALQMRELVKSAQEAYPEARTLLDVGAATGLLLSEASSLGFEAEGVEPSRSLATRAQKRGVLIHQGTLPHPALEEKRFDIVCLIDVIEHVSDPLALLREAASYLSARGLLVLVTPDVSSLAARLLGKRWWHFRLARICYFNQRSIEQAFKRSGLAIRRQRRAQWFFDVGYVAARIERYLPVGGLNRLIRRTPGLRATYRMVVPLNLRDSFLFLLSHRDGAA